MKRMCFMSFGNRSLFQLHRPNIFQKGRTVWIEWVLVHLHISF